MRRLQSLYQITSDNSLSFKQKMNQLLMLGTKVFNLELAIISRIVDKDYIVQHVISPEDSLLEGALFPLHNTYCIHTLHANEATSFHHAGKSGIAEHPCYINFGLESYIGAKLVVNGEPYGTINFSSSEPRANKFTQDDLEFIELLAHWVANEIARNQQLKLLEQQQVHSAHQQELLNEMGKLAGVGAWEVDLATDTLYWSETTRLIHEVEDDYIPVLETAIDFYLAGENRERVSRHIETIMQQGGSFSDEFEIVTHTGKIKWVASQGKAEFENGQCIRLFGAFQDITEQVYYRQQLEERHRELAAAVEARGRFLANMSHEIRTPINGVIGSLQVMDKKGLNENQQHFLGLAQNSADSLLAQINDVLDFVKIDANQLELENTQFVINQLLQDCVAAFSVSIKSKPIKLVTDFRLTDKVNIIADPTRIRQIYANLISNAVKFTMQGKITISSSITPLSAHKARLTLVVTDDGIGMSDKQLSNLFQPFKQADSSTTRKFGGTGLGLSISESLVKLMDGDIRVQSAQNEGSTFTVEIEVTTTGTDKSIENITPSPTKHIDLSLLHVLVVEDNEINQLVISEMLKQKNITHDIAADGLEALAKLDSQQSENQHYSLILMDCQMPNMDGYQATGAIRKLPSESSQIPIIALTANAMKGDRELCIKSGMTDYLSKPIKQEDLYAKLEEFA
ncbi:ATP-binding protein [Paraglaciecola aquimarina]|uniref:histidine kinase n=1 Tax=Paraglaciecola aquimarina TaxID=1235557 RepID=A0ABU3SRW0_9ALTE|nr:ATP-binding protein [Paraglaciecola aquimarina]MDU0352759.1 ATP-binding protein [Paraglaciecola aquimarina]